MIELISCTLQKPVSLYKRFLGIRFLSDKDSRKDTTLISILSFGSLLQCLKNAVDDTLTHEQIMKKFLKLINHCCNGLFNKRKNERGFQLYSILTVTQVNL